MKKYAFVIWGAIYFLGMSFLLLDSYDPAKIFLWSLSIIHLNIQISLLIIKTQR